MNPSGHSALVLAIYPMPHGFAYVLMSSPLSPIDFAFKRIRNKEKNARCQKAMIALIERHQPEALVLEDPTAIGSRRSTRIRRLIRSVAHYAQDHAIDVTVLSRALVRDCFEQFDAKTRYEIAAAIAHRIAAFEHLLPPARRRWDPEHPHIGIFAAAALALTYFDIWSR